MKPEILVIKLGALGDFIQAMGPAQAIRTAHPDARITLLTTKPFADFARGCPWFDEVWVDPRPKLWQPGKLLGLRRMLRSRRFARVYDLQTSDRSGYYFRLMGRPEWSGIAKGCTLPHANPQRDFMHTIDRQAEQLRMAGIDTVPLPDLSWVQADVSRFDLAEPFALMVPGGAPHRPAKRWPGERYGELALRMMDRGITPVLIGTEKEREQLGEIMERCLGALCLAGMTSFADIAALARRAAFCVGNDTGPMHICAAAGARCVVLFSAESDPARCAPRGQVTVLRRPDLAELPTAEVAQALGL